MRHQGRAQIRRRAATARSTTPSVTLKNSFHGRTITTLAATGQDVFHHDFLPLTEGFAYAEANDLETISRRRSPRTSAPPS